MNGVGWHAHACVGMGTLPLPEGRIMLALDGSLGEGGGQILRSSLALSMATGTPFHIQKIRERRAKPGLMRQHQTAVLAAANVCGAEVGGAHVGSRELWFTPGPVRPGDYAFNIGSAGSTTLVLQTVLPVLLTAEGPSTVSLEGGTHNIHAPPVDFLERAFLRLINRMGPRVSILLERYGFYPGGGGRIKVEIEPAQLKPLELLERGEVRRRLARSVVSRLPREIGERELAVVRERLSWPEESLSLVHLKEGPGPGNILTLEVESEHVTEVFTGFGERGVPAETVAKGAVEEAEAYLAMGAPVGMHLADQLLLPLALAGGGAFITQPLTLHSSTNIQIIETFLPVRIETCELTNGQWRVEVLRDRE